MEQAGKQHQKSTSHEQIFLINIYCAIQKIASFDLRMIALLMLIMILNQKNNSLSKIPGYKYLDKKNTIAVQ